MSKERPIPRTKAFSERITAAKVPASKTWPHWYDYAAGLEQESDELAERIAELLKSVNGHAERAGRNYATIKKLESENAKLREALEALLEKFLKGQSDYYLAKEFTGAPEIPEVARARQALAGEQPS